MKRFLPQLINGQADLMINILTTPAFETITYNILIIIISCMGTCIMLSVSLGLTYWKPRRH